MKTKILYVCTANRGRSPMLAAYTNNFARKMNIDVRAESSGTKKNVIADVLKESYENGEWLEEKDIISKYSIPKEFLGSRYTIVPKDVFIVLMEEGVYEILGHTPRLFTKELGGQNDLIFPVDSKNKGRVLEIYPVENKVFTAKEFISDTNYPWLNGVDIIDAYPSPGSPGEGAEQVYMDGIMKGTPDAWRMMCAECRRVAKGVVEKVHVMKK